MPAVLAFCIHSHTTLLVMQSLSLVALLSALLIFTPPLRVLEDAEVQPCCFAASCFETSFRYLLEQVLGASGKPRHPNLTRGLVVRLAGCHMPRRSFLRASARLKPLANVGAARPFWLPSQTNFEAARYQINNWQGRPRPMHGWQGSRRLSLSGPRAQPFSHERPSQPHFV